MKILPISDEFKAHLEERYQNINRDYYGQDFESWDGHDQEELMPGTPIFDAKVVHYNAPSGKTNKCGSCMYSHGTIPIGFIDDSIYKWTANKFASFGSICVVCPEKQNWTVEYIEPFRRENYPIALTNESDFSKGQYISGVCCVNSDIRVNTYCSRILSFNHVTDFNYNDICLLLYVSAVADEAITAFKTSGKSQSGIYTDFENYWNGWYDEAAGIKNFQKYPNILSLSAEPYARFALEYDLENPNYNSENWRNFREICIQTRWHARNLSDWKQYMTFNTNYEPSFDSDELILEASLNRNGIGIAGGGVSSFTIRNNCKLDTTTEGTFTQLTSYNPNGSQKSLAASDVLKPFDVSIQTATFRDTFYFYCLPYMRCENFTKEKMLREAAYLGFWFTGNKDSARSSILGKECDDPLVYCPVFDEDFVTTGEYLSGTELDQKGAFKNASHLEKVYIPETVKKIGDESFAGTALKSVKISADCEYSESSFPAECRIEFYGKSGEYGQLLDSGKREILDSTAARIYIRSESMADEKLRINHTAQELDEAVEAYQNQNKKYTLIEEITTDEEATEISRNQTPDGADYHFSRLFYTLESESSGICRIKINGDVVGYFEDMKGYICGKSAVECGLCFSEFLSTANPITEGAAMNVTGKSVTVADEITSFSLMCESGIPTGTVLKIYAVES